MFDCGVHPAHSGMSCLPYFDHINPAEAPVKALKGCEIRSYYPAVVEEKIFYYLHWYLLFVVATYNCNYANLYIAYVYFCMHRVFCKRLCIWDGVVTLHKWQVLFDVTEKDIRMYSLSHHIIKHASWWHVGVIYVYTVQQLNNAKHPIPRLIHETTI